MRFLFTFLLIAPLLAQGQKILLDTISIKSGDCIKYQIDDYRRQAIIWTTGNQDIAIPRVTFGTLEICGFLEGFTYISGAVKGSGTIRHMVVSVLPDESGVVKPKPKPKYQSTIDSDLLEVLRKIVSEEEFTNVDSYLAVSTNNRHLVDRRTSEPFIFLSQTIWSMARRLSREEILQALDIVKSQGFTAIQLLAHAHYMGPNVYKDEPFEGTDFLRPRLTIGSDFKDKEQYDWWDHLDFIIQECVKRELFVCLLPTWREQWNHQQNLHEGNAFAYGQFIGTRYRSYNPWIIWVMGGDEAPNTPQKLQIHRELAQGISVGINKDERYDNIIMTYHTHGPTSTVDFISEEEKFMDFNTIQSGHSLDNLEGLMKKSYDAQQKPVLDFEPFYTKDGKNTNEVRTIIYWGIFEGGFGTSYGSWNVWHCGARDDFPVFRIPESFHEGFSDQIGFLGDLLRSIPLDQKVPDQKLLINNETTGLDRIMACSAADKSFAMVFSPHGKSFTVNMSRLESKNARYYWFDPRTGKQSKPETIKVSGAKTFVPPTSGERFSGHDWVLVLQ